MTSHALRTLLAVTLIAGVAAACGDSSPTAPSVATIAAPPSASTPPDSPGALGQVPGAFTTMTATTTAPIKVTFDSFKGSVGNAATECAALARTYASGSEWFGVKLDQAPTGGSHTLADGMLTFTIANGTDTTFNWTSNVAVDAVFVKSGSEGHNLYLYNPESTAGTGLGTPLYTKKNGQQGRQGISHITVCYDVELLVSKTASTTFTRDFDWSISKTVDQPSVSIAGTGLATVNYTVGVTKDAGTDSDFAVSGTITVTNPHTSLTADGIVVTDSLTDHGAIAVRCPKTALGPGQSMVCDYDAALATGAARTNTGAADPATFGFPRSTGEAAVAFVTPTTVLDDSVTLSDTFDGAGIAGSLASSRTFPYTRTFGSADVACGETVTFPNTASITGDGAPKTASADVTVTRTCTPPPTPICTTVTTNDETAYGYLSSTSIRLNSLDGVVAERWGWTNGPLTGDAYTFDLYAGAGQNDLTKGTRVGTVTANRNASTWTITFTTTNGTLGATHVYLGADFTAWKTQGQGQVRVVANGLLGSTNNAADSTTSTHTITYTGATPPYLIMHAEVNGIVTTKCS